MTTEHAWRWAWPTWLATSLTGFAVLEHAAYARRRHPTLSRCLVRWLRGEPGLAALLVGQVALTVHLWRIHNEGR